MYRGGGVGPVLAPLRRGGREQGGLYCGGGAVGRRGGVWGVGGQGISAVRANTLGIFFFVFLGHSWFFFFFFFYSFFFFFFNLIYLLVIFFIFYYVLFLYYFFFFFFFEFFILFV
jgi:hypothetical protein